MEKAESEIIDRVFIGNSQMAGMMRRYDWDKSPLGPVDTWPDTLKSSLRIILTSAYPMFIWWGEDIILLYNDAYIDGLGSKHPHALGQSGEIIWEEVWDKLKPNVERVFKYGETVSDKKCAFYIERDNFKEETYYTYSHSPIVSESGTVEGFLCICYEDTYQVLSERRFKTISLISDIKNNVTLQASRDEVLQAISSNPEDFPFVILFTVSKNKFEFNNYSKSSFTEPLEDDYRLVDLHAFFSNMNTESRYQIVSIPDSLKEILKTPIHGVLPQKAVVMPVKDAGQNLVRGFFILGLSPVLSLNEAYLNFISLVSIQIDAVVTSIRALENERNHSREIEELCNIKSSFFSSVSQELRNPLISIINAQEYLSGKSQDFSHPVKESLEEIKTNSLNLMKQVNSLLSCSAIDVKYNKQYAESEDIAILSSKLSKAFSQQTLLETVLDTINDSFAYFTLDLNFIFVNKRVFEIRGRTREEYIGKHVLEIYPHIENSAFYEKLQKAALTKNPQFIEFFDASIDVWYEARIYPSDFGISLYLANINDRKQQEQEKNEIESRFKIVANAAPVLIAMSDTNMLCDFFNDYWFSFTGRTMEQELGNGWAEGVHPDDLNYCLNIYTNAFTRRDKFNMEYRLLNKDGEYRWILNVGVPRFTEDGVFLGYIGAGTDITEKKWAEALLNQYNKELEDSVSLRTAELLKANEQLQSLTSHLQDLRENERKLIAREIHDDLGQAMAALKIEISLLYDRIANSKSKFKTGMLEDLNSMDHALDESLLSVRKIISHLRPSLSDDLELVYEIKRLVTDLEKRVGITITVNSKVEKIELEPNIAIEVYRAVQESVTNIMKHSKATSAIIMIDKVGNKFKFMITDNGIGFDKKLLSEKKSFGILGLRERAQRIGASLAIESSIGKGTTVELLVEATSKQLL